MAAGDEPWDDTLPAARRGRRVSLVPVARLPLRDEAGRAVQWCGTNTDVAEQRAAENALRLGEERFHTLVDTAAAMRATSAEGGFVVPQPRRAAFAGQDQEQYRG